jgi:hypothetical protein
MRRAVFSRFTSAIITSPQECTTCPPEHTRQTG